VNADLLTALGVWSLIAGLFGIAAMFLWWGR